MKLAAHSNSCQAEAVQAARRATVSSESQSLLIYQLLLVRFPPAALDALPNVYGILNILPRRTVRESIVGHPDTILAGRLLPDGACEPATAHLRSTADPPLPVGASATFVNVISSQMGKHASLTLASA